ncbi:40S ribosomal protein S15a-5 [Populus alba x Populus x berolinensis]|uniref:40S ribosomal protein S15a-5 n=1 Tax=Populus alba x Populus x berolinensis TaxID=444605 RepID=A0AAD6QCE6_9ROSI|nr:40S ribosomal protein S15a-5 [Populus alba x Populus x berolinensis]
MGLSKVDGDENNLHYLALKRRIFSTNKESGSGVVEEKLKSWVLRLGFERESGRMGRRILNDALRAIVNAERRSKSTVELQPISTVMSSFLKIMKDRGYIKNFHVYDPHRVGRITVELQGRVTDCRALTYRQDIKAKDIEAYRLRNLPTRQWGYAVVTTPDGILDHEEAINRNVGGQGRVTDCRALTYRQDIKAKDIEAYRLRNLPTRQWGYVVVTTPDGILDHEEAISRNVGGFFYGKEAIGSQLIVEV